MKRVVGYVVAVAGLVVMVLSFGIFGEVDLFGIDSGSVYVSGAGIVLVVVGVVFSMMGGSRVKKRSEEVPIYEGVGKKRRIVGYRRD